MIAMRKLSIPTIGANARFRQADWPILLYPKAYLLAHPSAKLVVEGGMLHLGYHWEMDRPRQSEFILRQGSSLRLTGTFKVYSGALISVNAGAQLSFGSG